MSSPSSSCSDTSSNAPSSPRPIRSTSKASDALAQMFHSPSSFPSSACAYPSWPKNNSLHTPPQLSHGPSYISDEDLFGLDELDGSLPYLSEAPLPPREAHQWNNVDDLSRIAIAPAPAMPLLQPLRPKLKRSPKSPPKKGTFHRVPKATNLASITEGST